jgi:peptidoglycan/xylan/chitin deacetylase (PgdA/CDA1 family)
LKHLVITTLSALALLVSCLLLWGTGKLWIPVIAIFTIYHIIIAYGSAQIKANYFLKSINKGEQAGVAFTFDDGPDENLTRKFMDLLEAERIVATFFVIGRKAEASPQLLKEIDNRGHYIANHSYSHSNYIAFFPSGKLKADLVHCNTIIEQAIEKRPVLFRPPFGVTNPIYSRVLKKMGLISVGWTIRSFDTVLKDKTALAQCSTRAISNGSIILFHDTQQITLDILPDVIRFCRDNNLKIVSLPELINKSPYA